MKISTVEKWILGLAAVFLLLTAGYQIIDAVSARPYAVEGHTLPDGWAHRPEPSAQIRAGINLNTADADLLESLPCIGEALARAIVDDREANGPFYTPEELVRVSGIGQGTVTEILDYITVG